MSKIRQIAIYFKLLLKIVVECLLIGFLERAITSFGGDMIEEIYLNLEEKKLTLIGVRSQSNIFLTFPLK
jgi:hypothetical protein